MSEQTELLQEIRDLLLVIAEPSLAKRDQKLREILRGIVGKSKPKINAIRLMDGTRNQAEIKKQSGLDQGELSRCVKALREAGLFAKDQNQNPKLIINIPPNFFENGQAE